MDIFYDLVNKKKEAASLFFLFISKLLKSIYTIREYFVVESGQNSAPSVQDCPADKLCQPAGSNRPMAPCRFG